MTTAATRIIRPLMHAALLLAASAQAQTPACDQFKAVLATRLHSDVQGYTMDSVPSNIAVPPGAKVIGTCGGGAYKILLRKGDAATESPVAARQAPAPVSVPMAVPRPVARPLQSVSVPASAAPAPREDPVKALPVIATAAAPVVAVPAPSAPRDAAFDLPGTPSPPSSGFIAAYGRWLLALALLPIAVWGWRWIAYRRLYDANGLPRGPRF